MDCSVDTTLDPWLEELWQTLATLLPPLKPLPIIPDFERPPPRLSLHVTDDAPQASTSKAPPMATVTRNQRATAADHFQDVRYFDLEVEQDLLFVPRPICLR